MSTKREIENTYKSYYRYILKSLLAARGEVSDGEYRVLADFVEDLRGYTADVSGLKQLPPVPKDK